MFVQYKSYDMVYASLLEDNPRRRDVTLVDYVSVQIHTPYNSYAYHVAIITY